MHPLDSILDRWRQEEAGALFSRTRAMGTAFEDLCAAFLTHDPIQSLELRDVKTFADWARERDLDQTDTGIDLVAELRNEPGFAAIQCKFLQTDKAIPKPEIASFLAASAALLALAACGGGGGSATTPGGGEGPATTLAELILPQQRPQWAGLPLVIQFGDELRIGGAPPPARTALVPVATHGAATVRHGTVQDGVGAATLIDYLQRDATRRSTDTVLRWDAAPVVRYVEGATPGNIDVLVRAVQLINANLPRDFQLAVSATPVTAAAAAAITSLASLPAGEILVEFAERSEWGVDIPPGPPPGGWALFRTVNAAIQGARVWLAPGGRQMLTAVHELVHALGRDHPDPSRFPDTVMLTGPQVVSAAGYVLHPLDREALFAVYGTLDAGDTPADIATDLGPWADDSIHVRGDLDNLAFGAALRNGLVQPWALGPRPGLDLEDNPQLNGSASWDGRLLGFTPAGASVAGAAGLAVDLGTLSGTLDFTGLESWSGAPGLASTGATWGDGDLNYTVGVTGNTFARTGGDTGTVTGAFFGAGHEGMGGTLVRDDLAAGFAGTR